MATPLGILETSINHSVPPSPSYDEEDLKRYEQWCLLLSKAEKQEARSIIDETYELLGKSTLQEWSLHESLARGRQMLLEARRSVFLTHPLGKGSDSERRRIEDISRVGHGAQKIALVGCKRLRDAEAFRYSSTHLVTACYPTGEETISDWSPFTAYEEMISFQTDYKEIYRSTRPLRPGQDLSDPCSKKSRTRLIAQRLGSLLGRSVHVGQSITSLHSAFKREQQKIAFTSLLEESKAIKDDWSLRPRFALESCVTLLQSNTGELLCSILDQISRTGMRPNTMQAIGRSFIENHSTNIVPAYPFFHYSMAEAITATLSKSLYKPKSEVEVPFQQAFPDFESRLLKLQHHEMKRMELSALPLSTTVALSRFLAGTLNQAVDSPVCGRLRVSRSGMIKEKQISDQ